MQDVFFILLSSQGKNRLREHVTTVIILADFVYFEMVFDASNHYLQKTVILLVEIGGSGSPCTGFKEFNNEKGITIIING